MFPFMSNVSISSRRPDGHKAFDLIMQISQYSATYIKRSLATAYAGFVTTPASRTRVLTQLFIKVSDRVSVKTSFGQSRFGIL